MKVLLTGAGGFVGWHTRVRLRALTEHVVIPVDRAGWAQLPDLIVGADAVIHVAGVNRLTAEQVEKGEPVELVERGNVELAESLAAAIRAAGSIKRVVYANSTQSGNSTPYGRGKVGAGDLLSAATEAVGAAYVDVRLPNLVGEHGHPGFNSFVATFVDAVARGAEPYIADRPIDLLHVQDAAGSLIEGLTVAEGSLEPKATSMTVRQVFDLLVCFAHVYAGGDIPPLTTKLEVDLFNTYRAALFPERYPMPLTTHVDARGRLVETVRAHGGQGQTFVSTTLPAMTRGDHFHLRKVERFVVLAGSARISLRKLFTTEVVSFDVGGDVPVVVDMPTMWVHNITNTGSKELTTLFWANTLFDPEAPDTYWEPVNPEGSPV